MTIELVNKLEQLLADIDSGKVKIQTAPEQAYLYHTNVIFNTDNGWEITVFIDGYTIEDFDYIDNAKSPTGEKIDFDFIWDNDLPIRNYRPKDFKSWFRPGEVDKAGGLV